MGVAPAEALQVYHAEPDGVVAFPGEREGEEMLASVPAGTVWGIGRQYEALLREHGVTTARGLKNLPSRWVKSRMTVRGLRTASRAAPAPCAGPAPSCTRSTQRRTT